MPECSFLQKSLLWCQGRVQRPGIRRRLYFTARQNIVQWPRLPKDAMGRPMGAALDGEFLLAADAAWDFIDIIVEKSQLTSEPQGEYPAQSQLNRLVAVHPGIEIDATLAAAWFNNNECVFMVEDMNHRYRVVGNEHYPMKVSVTHHRGGKRRRAGSLLPQQEAVQHRGGHGGDVRLGGMERTRGTAIETDHTESLAVATGSDIHFTLF